MIEVNNITYRIGTRTIFENTSMSVMKGQKIGLIGPNGSGKTTLFRLLKGEMEVNGGEITTAKDLKIVTVAQEIPDTDVSVIDFVVYSDKEYKAIIEEMAKTSDGYKLAEIHDRFNDIGGASARSRAASILSGLGFSNDDLERPLKEFSGGWRMRVALAATLFVPSDILLLDEPTNHLDLETSIWLENYLERVPTTILLISHDRNILNRLCNYIISIEEMKLVRYGGNYDSYEKNRAIKLNLLKHEAVKFEQRRKHLQSFVDRFRYKATKAKQAQSRLKMIERMGEKPEIPRDYTVTFDFPSPDLLASPLMQLEGVTAGYGNKEVLHNLNLRLDQDDRIAFLGANGNGKTTLAKIISEKIMPLKGEVKKAAKLKVAYFAQHQAEELDMKATPYEIMVHEMPGIIAPKVRAHLGRYGLTGTRADTVVENLSGGEKSRLVLALITKDAPHVLILDEPTNHLDIQSRDALIEALNEYNGAVILITHDLHIIELTCDRLWLIEDGKCSEYKGNLGDFMKRALEKTNEAKTKVVSHHEEKKVKKVDKMKLGRLLKQFDELEMRRMELERELSKGYNCEVQKEHAQIIEELKAVEEEYFSLAG